jgi:glycosyltransferase involved in cell wall biosynthesis
VSADLAVIIPTRDRCDLLDATLASLARQNTKSFETVVADHGSTDATSETVRKWSGTLRLAYRKLASNSRSPGWVRDEGTRCTSADILVFLDTGMIASPTFVEAHRDQQRNGLRVGIGMCHGYRVLGRPQGDWPRMLATHSPDQLRKLVEADRELRDERFGIADLEHAAAPWIYGWSGNISVHRKLYAKAGGFDREREHRYEDIDLSYRLHTCGGRFGVVGGGWALHLPHPRDGIGKRMRSTEAGWRLSYSRYRSLPIEAAWLTLPNPLTWRHSATEYGQHISTMADLLERIAEGAAPVKATPCGLGLSGPALLVGGSPGNADVFDYVACARRTIAGSERVWGCAGILIPRPARSLECVVVSDIWRRLGAVSGRPRLLDRLIREIARVSGYAIFLDSGAGRPGDLTVDDLSAACLNQGIRWRTA